MFDVEEVSPSLPEPPATGGQEGATDAPARFDLRFELFAPPAHMAEGRERLLARAQALFERLLLDFPGMVSPALRGAAHEWRRVEPRDAPGVRRRVATP